MMKEVLKKGMDMIRIYKYITRTRHLHSCFWSRFCLYISDVAPFCFLGGGGFVRYPIHAPLRYMLHIWCLVG